MSDITLDTNLVTIQGDANFYTVHGGNSHLGYGTNGDAYLSIGSGGSLIIRTFDGSNYKNILRIYGTTGQIAITNQAGHESIRLDSETGTVTANRFLIGSGWLPTDDHPRLIALEAELATLKARIGALEAKST